MAERNLPNSNGHPEVTPPDGKMHPDLEWRESKVRPGTGERRVRIVRPRSRHFRRVGPGQLSASEEVITTHDTMAQTRSAIKRILIGPPLATAQEIHERLSKVKALAIFSSDALSSSAYATEEVLYQLAVVGTVALVFSLPIALAIGVLLLIVATSYRQTVHAYPGGGGVYMVAKENLGRLASLVAASALLSAYILTVAVSTSAGFAALISAFPDLAPYRVAMNVIAIAFLIVANLRGIRESGNIFALPTYLFIGGIAVMIGVGLFRALVLGNAEPVNPTIAQAGWAELAQPVGLILLLRAFSSGAVALTGIEAIADGVPAFKPPEAKNAATTLAWMAAILATFFIGITVLAHLYGIAPLSGGETVVSQIARRVFGDNLLYYFIQMVTTLILLLAANTAFADFPRLSYFVARDGFLPRQFTLRGDRLAYSTGIVILGLIASLLVVVFRGDTHALIPLYAVGVFLSFTSSQSGMVVRWLRNKGPGWRWGLFINGTGAVITASVLAINATVKFMQGAWLVMVLIPAMVTLFLAIRRHYDRFAAGIAWEGAPPPINRPPAVSDLPVILPVLQLTKAVAQALAYARTISSQITAVHVTDSLKEGEALQKKWAEEVPDVPMVVLESPYRTMVGPLVAYVDAIDDQFPDKEVTVVLSEAMPNHWWERVLHTRTVHRLRSVLLERPNTVVTTIPYALEYGPSAEAGEASGEVLGEQPGWQEQLLGLMLALGVLPVAALVGYALAQALMPGQPVGRALIQLVVALAGSGAVWWHFKRNWTRYVGLD